MDGTIAVDGLGGLMGGIARLPRARVVWGALGVTMTLVTGALFLSDDKPGGIGGVSLPALVAPAGGQSLESVLEVREPMGEWSAIVIDHTGTPYATAETLDEAHRARGLRGLGYHFVIGNGNGLGDGELHVGSRWLTQASGAHTGGEDGEWYNRHAIGICLVGDGERRGFTDAQMARLTELVSLLRRELDIPLGDVVLHRDVAPTNSPGRSFPAAAFYAGLESTR